MELSERAFPVRMKRVAVVALAARAREVLVALAESGTVDLVGPLGSGEGPALEALRRVENTQVHAAHTTPALARQQPDIARLERDGARELLAGEVELDRRRASAVQHAGFALFVGWTPQPALAQLSARLEALGAGVIELRKPRGQQPPTLLAPAPRADAYRPLLSTYGAVPYEDVDPTPFVAVTYCLMFGMMFGDVGHGLLLVLAALALRYVRRPRLDPLRKAWQMIAACGVASVVFGALYGEFFGPTKVLPTLWLDPLESPTRLLVVAIAAGGCLLAASYLIGIVNRWREGGALLALTTGSGAPGLALLCGGSAVVLGATQHLSLLVPLGLTITLVALVPLVLGFRAEAGGGPTGVLEVVIGVFDALMRLFSNVFSFARLAAFGLMHAAIGQVVLQGAGSLTGTPIGDLVAAVVFFVGWTFAFALEGLVVTVQALRLEYYELFSRLFVREGLPFKPWSLPIIRIDSVASVPYDT